MTWSTHVTVAALMLRDDQILMVEERDRGRLCLNQPAGHVEAGETLEEAVIREALEETGLCVRPLHLLGVYVAPALDGSYSYYRVAYLCAAALGEPAPRDTDIIQARWMPVANVLAQPDRWRSPVVGACILDALAGRQFPLDLVRDMTHAS